MKLPTLKEELDQVVRSWEIEMRGWEKAIAACSINDDAHTRFKCIHGTLKGCVEDIKLIIKSHQVIDSDK